MAMGIENSIFLTFDMDWAPDEVMEYTYQIIHEAGVKATFFVTNDTPYLSVLRADPNVELGIHPNLNNFFTQPRTVNETPAQIVDHLLALIPEARAYRMHALTDSSILNSIFSKRLQINCNVFIPMLAGFDLKPWRDNSGLMVMPYFFEDDTDILGDSLLRSSPSDYVCKLGLKIFDFHPIHVFLNTTTYAQYMAAKPYYQFPDKLASYRNGVDVVGVAGFLSGVIAAAKTRGLAFRRISDILESEV